MVTGSKRLRRRVHHKRPWARTSDPRLAVAAAQSRSAMEPPRSARFALAWRILAHDKGRTALAVAGVFMAILLVFVQLGFFIAVPRGGILLYDWIRFDLLIASSGYEYQAQPGQFSRNRLDQAQAAPEVAQAAALYFGSAKWRDGEDAKSPDLFVIGFVLQADVSRLTT